MQQTNSSLSTITPRQQMASKRIQLKRQQVEKMKVVLSEIEKDKKELEETNRQKQTKRKELEKQLGKIHDSIQQVKLNCFS
jgi:hypothetical protein